MSRKPQANRLFNVILVLGMTLAPAQPVVSSVPASGGLELTRMESAYLRTALTSLASLFQLPVSHLYSPVLQTGTPDLTPTALTAPASATTQQSIQVSWTVQNQGTGSAQPWWYDNLYISTDNVWDNQDVLVGNFYKGEAVAAGASYAQTQTANVPQVSAGNYYLILRADGNGYVSESNEANNDQAVAITLANPDLIPTALTAPASAATQQPITLTWTIQNQDTGEAQPSWYDNLYLSPDNLWDAQDTLFGQFWWSGAVAAGASYVQTQTVSLPGAPAGDYYLILRTDGNNYLYESNDANNDRAVAITLANPDLTPMELTVPASAATQQPITVTWTVQNQGAGTAYGSLYWWWGNTGWYDNLYLSTDNVWDAQDTLFGQFWWNQPVAAGASYTQTQLVSMPQMAAGDYYLILRADGNGYLYESSEANSDLAVAITLLNPDLAPTALTAPASAATQQPITVTWTIQNQGIGDAQPSWYDNLYLSTDSVWDGQDINIGSFSWNQVVTGTGYNQTVILPGASYVQTQTVTLPGVSAGDYYLILRADGNGYLYESSEANNDRVVAITLANPDLTPTELTAPPSAATQQPITLTWTVQNQGTGTAYGSLYWWWGNTGWFDNLYLSTDNVWDDQDIYVTQFWWNQPVAAGTSYVQTQTVTLPGVPEGDYYLILRVDGNGYLYESDETNNDQATAITLANPDLTPTDLIAPTSAATQQPITVTWTIQNQGAGLAQPGWYDNLYLSTDNIWDNQDTNIGSFWWNQTVAAGTSYTQTQIVSMPQVPAGNYYLILRVDVNGNLYETNEGNNDQAVAITLMTPDLTPTGLTAPAAAAMQQEIEVSWSVQNGGTGAAYGSSYWWWGDRGWFDNLYLSTDNVWDSQDTSVGSFWWNQPVAAGASYSQTQRLTIPSVPAGSYYLILRTDESGLLYESNEANNETQRAIAIQIVDAVITPWNTLDSGQVGGLGDLDFSPDGVRLVAAGGSRAFTWDLQASRLRTQFTAHTAQIDTVDFSPAGDQILSGARDGTSRIWDAANGQQTRSFSAAPGQPNPVVYSTDGAWVFAGSGLNLPRLWDTITGEQLRTFPGHTGMVNAVALSPDGSRALTGSSDQTAILWDIATGARLFTLSGHTDVINSVAFSPDGAKALTASNDGSIRLWEVASGAQTAIFIQGNPVVSAAYSPDGKYIVSCNGWWWSGTAYLWDASSGALIRTFSETIGDPTAMNGVAFSPDQALIATSHSDGRVRLWQSGLEAIPVRPITPLAVGSELSLTLHSYGLYYFEVEAQAGQNLLITLDPGASGAALDGGAAKFANLTSQAVTIDPTTVRMVASHGRLPSAYQYDYFAQASVSDLHAEIPIAPASAGKYYILVFAPFLSGGSINVSLRAEYADFHLSGIFPNTAGNAGNLTAEIQGTGLTTNTVASLVSPSGQRITGTETLLISGASLFATFNLRDVEVGAYAVEIQRPSDGAVRTISNTVKVTRGSGPALTLSLEGPVVVRPGRVYQYNLVYKNVGDADLPAPFLAVTSSVPGTIFYATSGYSATDTLIWLASSSGSPGDVLAPGQGGSVPFLASTGQSLALGVGVAQEDDTPFDWAAVEQILKPVGITTDAWRTLWISTTAAIGSTHSEVLQTLRSLNRSHLGPTDYEELLSFALAIAAEESQSTVFAKQDDNDISLVPLAVIYQLCGAKKASGYTFVATDVVVVGLDGNDIGANNFNPLLPTIVITHGRNGTKDEPRYKSLATALSKTYSGYNVVRVVWQNGAGMTLCQITERSVILPDVAREAVRQINKQALNQKYSRWGDTIYIGESFGNGVNYYMSDQVSIAGATAKGKALILNPAWSEAYKNGEPKYVNAFKYSIAIQTVDWADSKKKTGTKAILYVDPKCGDQVCNTWGEQHTSGVRLVTCLLGYIDPDHTWGCGSVITNTVLADQLVMSKWDKIGFSSAKDYNGYAGCLNDQGKLCEYVPQIVPTAGGGFIIVRTVQLDVTAVRAVDPNDKLASPGLGQQHLITAQDTLYYTINFENTMTATAPVQELVVVDYLDPNLDWTTLQFSDIAYSDNLVTVPGGALQFSSRDFPASTSVTGTLQGPMAIDMAVSLNVQTGRVEWHLWAIDTGTNLPPEDALAGFLLPENGTGRGQGHVSFSIKPKADLASGTRIANTASIVFDTNDPIETNEVWNTVSQLSQLQFSSALYTVAEDGGSAIITVRRTGGSAGMVTVNYSTNDLTAVAGSDYITASGTITFADGDTTDKTFTIPILADALVEGDETLSLTLSGPTGGATLGTLGTAVLKITDAAIQERKVYLPLVQK